MFATILDKTMRDNADNVWRHGLSSSINGAVHIVVPGKFLIFHKPADDLPLGRQWVDEGGQRRFSASFFADLLQDLGVAHVCPPPS